MSANAATPLTRPTDRLRRRKAVNRGMELIAWVAAAVAVGILVLLVQSVAHLGASEFNLNLFTKAQVGYDPTVPQGLSNAFIGTLVIVGVATAMALPFGILVAIYVNEFAPRAIKNIVSLGLDVLNGIPAIVIAIFVFGLLVLRHGQSGLAGSFALAILMLPLVARSTIEVLALVPNSLREASLGLGVARWRTTLGIVLPQTIGGVLTGATLAVARIAGETAPLLFCSSLVPNGVSWNPLHALQSVPLAIFELSESPYPQDHARAWSAALVLILFILFASLGARWLATRSKRKIGRAGR
ncbi:MAG TPA: phosphate ABC transporter permease PstA [Gaiellaceae bacterium]|nr:phosphate ABC transporter permease PstA [Gaiellaceae bacterium]